MNQAISIPDELIEVVIGDPTAYDFENCQTAVDHFGPYNRTDVLYALVAASGNYSHMARLLRRSRAGVERYVSADSELFSFRASVVEGMIDEIERSVFEQALSGDPTQQRYILSTLGKKRGYTTRQEQTGPDGGPIEHNDPLSQMLADIAKNGKRIVDMSGETGNARPVDMSGGNGDDSKLVPINGETENG